MKMKMKMKMKLTALMVGLVASNGSLSAQMQPQNFDLGRIKIGDVSFDVDAFIKRVDELDKNIRDGIGLGDEDFKRKYYSYVDHELGSMIGSPFIYKEKNPLGNGIARGLGYSGKLTMPRYIRGPLLRLSVIRGYLLGRVIGRQAHVQAKNRLNMELLQSRLMSASLLNRAEILNVGNHLNSLLKYTEGAFAFLNGGVTKNSADIFKNTQRIDALSKNLETGLANQSALSMLVQPNGVGKTSVSAAVGGYRGKSALAIGVGSRITDAFTAKAGVAFNTYNGGMSYGASVGYEF
ncbi:YadA C-terminal domain-containing protein [[Haemophilus] ducreyi]|uniref:Serum resistance protein A2 n=1 Tax=Haemophilus ducreyi TaxID=730 RepID=Q58ZL2_HAEDC|nr:YadA C-terminal domain-containing protein [[Haemophilus] ducreyi]AAU12586.1 serum resistance protein A2 [[Haemophilus] ducreyi]AAU12587.1 serum resistance protein A2 [[Haemophilus] ducreyi]AAU12596.1 serum resistance protein A2 [[Haemophilus] ducreyi]